MLDMRCKFLDVMKTFIGKAKVIQMVVKYDNKIWMTLLVVAFQLLNHGIDGLVELTNIDDNDDSIFGVPMTSNEVTLQGLLKNDFFLFHHLHVR